ncbi:MAG TPA: MFS transporter [Azospirillum sp.]|nr:MFS transporter [Azospirillum sp.]
MPIPSPRASLPLLASVVAVVLSTGFTGTLLPLAVGDAAAAAGVASAHFAGFLVGAPATGWIIARLGVARAALLFALGIALTTVGLVAVGGLPAWMVLRFAAGICVSGYFVLVESRLNDLADAATRGRLMAAYLVAFYAAQAVGASIAGFAGPDGAVWMLATLPLPVLGALPLLAASAPAVPAAGSGTPWPHLLSRAPAAYASSFAGGLLLGAFYGLGPVYATAVGGGAFASGPFMAAAMLGGMVLLGPVGRGADLGRRERWLTAALAAAAGATVVLTLVPADDLMMLAIAGALLGASAFTLYPLASGCVNDAVCAEERLAANALLLLLSASGSCVGPILAGWAMEHLGAGRFLLPAAAACIVASSAVIRTRPWPVPRSASRPA